MGDPTADWINVKDKYYKVNEFFKMTQEFRVIEIEHCFVAVAKHGGPIAITKILDRIVIQKANDPTRDNICIFSNNGELLSLIPNNTEKSRIVGFDFVEDETLVIIFEEGRYLLIDPFLGSKKVHNLGGRYEKSTIVEAKTVDNGFAFYTRDNEFFYINNVHDPQLHKFIDPQIGKPNFFLPISSKNSNSERIELQVTHPEAGVVVIVENESSKLYYNQTKSNVAAESLPTIPDIIMIAISPGHKLVAYLTKSCDLHVVSADYSSNTHIKTSLKYEKPPKSLVWCAEDCVCLIFNKHMLIVAPDAIEKISFSNKGCFGFPEVDGIKLISSSRCEMLRKLPDSYVAIFRLLSFEPGALLFEAYKSFENRNPLPDEDIRNKKQELALGVQQCIDAASFEINSELQSKLLKAAAYGKAFLSPTQIDHNQLSEVCKTLRVVNAFKNEVFARTMTYQIIKRMEDSLIIKILLRYRLHWLAFEICKHLSMNQKIRSQIYVNWACCKVESSEPDEQLCYLINDKLKNEKGISFTEIAHKAIDLGKKTLATKLLEYEPSILKKVPVLLWMENYEKALEDALNSKDSNLIYMVIIKMVRSGCDKKYIYELMSQDSITRAHLITYYRYFYENELSIYLKHLKMDEECGFSIIQQAYQTTDLAERIKLLNFAFKFFQNSQKDQNFYCKVIEDQLWLLNEMIKMKKELVKESPINSILDTMLKKDELKDAVELQKTCIIPDRRFLLMRVKVLIEKKKWDDLQKLVLEKNKKTPVIPYETIANLLIREKELAMAEVFILKMPDIDDQLYMLKAIGNYKKGAEVAIQHKKLDYLQEIKESTNDTSLKNYIDNYLLSPDRK